jgi:catechol 2,3-dioxygenase-like lactoylglutathione lyase family enzyme
LVDDQDFDAIFARILARKLPLLGRSRPNAAGPNHCDGGRGLCFEDPDGHVLEIITRPYGSGGWNT